MPFTQANGLTISILIPSALSQSCRSPVASTVLEGGGLVDLYHVARSPSRAPLRPGYVFLRHGGVYPLIFAVPRMRFCLAECVPR